MQALQPSNLELQALGVLWQSGPATVRDVRDDLPDRKDRAYTTVLTVPQKLERKGLVRRASVRRRTWAERRALLFAAARSKREILRPVLRELITNVFLGSPGGLIEHVLTEVGLTSGEKNVAAASLRRLLWWRDQAARQQTNKTKPKENA
ncbi:MAG: BlaI/MecI/CopY family transcriptional regulator [Verrucomicrobiales bacterium]